MKDIWELYWSILKVILSIVGVVLLFVGALWIVVKGYEYHWLVGHIAVILGIPLYITVMIIIEELIQH